MPFDPKAIANFFLAAAESEGKRLTPLQVIKLVYIAHGWNLALTKHPLINEHPEAWKYGPVVPSLYHEFKRFGNGPIEGRATDLVPKKIGDWAFDIREVLPPDPEKDKATCVFLERVWDVYKRYSGSQLSSLTHQLNTPWRKTWDEVGQYTKGKDIPEGLIREHYEELARQNG